MEEERTSHLSVLALLEDDGRSPRYCRFPQEVARAGGRYATLGVVSCSGRPRARFTRSTRINSLYLQLPSPPGLRMLTNAMIFFSLGFVFKVKHGVNVVLSGGYMPGLAAALLRQLSWSHMVFDVIDNYDSFDMWKKHRFLATLARTAIYRSTDGFIFVGEKIKERVMNKYSVAQKKPCKIIGHGCDRIETSRRFARDALKIPIGSIVVTYAGAIEENRGLVALTRAFAMAKERLGTRAWVNLNPKLVLVGPGPLYARLREVAKEAKVERDFMLVGWQSPESAALYRAASDILALVPLEDDFNEYSVPYKLPEYLAAGKAIIFTDVGVLKQYAYEGAGLLVAAGDVTSLSEALIKLMTEPATREKLGARGRAIAERREFNWNHIGETLVQFLESLSTR